MLIINADDLGRSVLATDRILASHARGSLTSTSAMVFMADSERAAGLARTSRIDVGLHLNFTEEFNGQGVPALLSQYHKRIVRLLTRNRYASLMYYPGLRKQFQYVFAAQLEEFQRLYGVFPSHINGHHHMHLCANMLLGGIIAKGQKIRRTFSFRAGEKSPLNRAYRAMIDRWVLRRYRSTDFLFSLPSCRRSGRLDEVVKMAGTANVELETHPEVSEDYDYLMSDTFVQMIAPAQKGTYAGL
jgi:predicted glycoside hydrolase/deacetylase ChbG (UPF0249 family)